MIARDGTSVLHAPGDAFIVHRTSNILYFNGPIFVPWGFTSCGRARATLGTGGVRSMPS